MFRSESVVQLAGLGVRDSSDIKGAHGSGPVSWPGVALGGSPDLRREGEAEARQALLECLRNREADVLRFLTNLRVPVTSSQAERDLRPAKTQQKISGRLRSETATRYRYAVRGYASTAVKHGIDALTAIRDARAGNPWMPAVPETPDHPKRQARNARNHSAA